MYAALLDSERMGSYRCRLSWSEAVSDAFKGSMQMLDHARGPALLQNKQNLYNEREFGIEVCAKSFALMLKS